MLINVNFTIKVPQKSLPALYELAAVEAHRTGSERPADARDFVKYDAECHVVDYLDANGVEGVEVVKFA